MKAVINTLSLTGLFIIFFIPALSGQMPPSDKDYKELHSQHFTIVYYSGRVKAEKILTMAENIRHRLIKKFPVDDDIHTYIVLIDNNDLANGLATILPANIIILYDIPPDIFTEISLLNYYNWAEKLITHEYTHILHLNLSKDIFYGLRYIGFKYLAPNLLLPVSSIEGMAVCMETVYTPMGRARSSYKEMMLRTAVYEHNLPSIDEISTFLNKIPGGEGPYIWGGSFHYYLFNKLSEKSIIYSYYDNSGCISTITGCIDSKVTTCAYSCLTCFPLNSIVENYSGLSYYEHYNEWINSLKKKYKKEIIRIKDPTIPELLKRAGNFSTIFDLVYYKNKIYFSGHSLHTGYGLYEYNLQSDKLKIVIEDMYISSIIMYRDKFYFAGLEIYDNVYLYFSLYKFDPKSHKLKHYDKIKRIVDIAQVDGYLLVVQNSDNERIIKLITSEGEVFKTLMKFEKYESAYDFTFINKDEFFFILKKENDFFDIFYCDITKREFKRITNNPAIELSLFLDGTNLYFISDHNGRFNIYRYNTEDETFSQVTDFISGAMRFVKNEQDFFIVYYQSEGSTVARVNEKNIKDNIVEYNSQKDYHNYSPSDPKGPITGINISKESEYSTIKNLFSNFIYWPTLTVTGQKINPGMNFQFSDVLFRNFLGLQVEYNFYMKKANGGIDYLMARNKVAYRLKSSSFYSPYNSDKSITTNHFEFKRTDNAEFQFDFFKGKLFRGFFLFSGVSYLKYTYFEGEESKKDHSKTGETYYNSFYTGCQFNNAVSYAYSVIPEKGWVTSLQYILMKKWFGSSFNLDLLHLSINKYLKTLFRHHILKFSTHAGAVLNDSKDEPYSIQTIVFRTFSSLYDIPLKGYSYYANTGRNFWTGNVSYNFPIFWLERGIKNMPLLFSHLWMNFFYEAGNCFNDIKKFMPLQVVGSGLHFVFKFYYQTDVDLTAGITYELGGKKAWNWYIGSGAQF